MDEESVEESFSGRMRLGLTVAAQTGSQLAMELQYREKQAKQLAEEDARKAVQRLEAERATARAELEKVNDPSWWDRADINAVANTYQTAIAWDEKETIEKMQSEIKQRYGIDAAEIDPQQLGEEIEARSKAKEERAAAAALNNDELADAIDKNHDGVPDVLEGEQAGHEAQANHYEGLSEKLQQQNVPKEQADTRQLVESANAKPASQAPKRGIKGLFAKKRRGIGAAKQTQRELGR